MRRLSGSVTGKRRPYPKVVNSESSFINGLEHKFPFLNKLSPRTWFFGSWALLLLLSGGFAALNGFDPGVCRHIAIGFVLLYFFYLYLSYKYSPLVSSAGKSWWTLGTGRTLDIIASNPVKILLSVSLLGLFVFIDIGFAIVFLNFLLFNEAFLCINYAVAGLSAGSKRNAILFGVLGAGYMAAFILNLLYGPYIFRWLLGLPQLLYLIGYIGFALCLAYVVTRLLYLIPSRRRKLVGFVTAIAIFTVAFLFFPKERILEKAAMTKYRIDVLSMPVEDAITGAYEEGKTYEPVIRAAQNQWFINTFIYDNNNPAVYGTGFTLLQHAPQNKGAKYNAQATDLVASRFLIGEHGMWAVLLYVLLLVLPAAMLASFYKLYPDFTNRINDHYPRVTAGFSILNYLLITALLVILAATGRYIFFGQDLPFGSILSKQSILFPCLLILAAVLCFRQLPLEYYGNRRKLVPGLIVFILLGFLLFVFRPQYNRNREFSVAGLANNMENYIHENVQPLLDHFDTSYRTRRLSFLKKDELFTDSLNKLLTAGFFVNANKFFSSEMLAYSRSGFTRHLDQRKLLYLDISNGSPRLQVNDNYFRVEAPPHLQQLWTGNVFGNDNLIHLNTWNRITGESRSAGIRTTEPGKFLLTKDICISVHEQKDNRSRPAFYLVNKGSASFEFRRDGQLYNIVSGDSTLLVNPSRISFVDPTSKQEQVVSLRPDAFMKNYYVNGSRFYAYPLAERFIWARNFSEAVAADYTSLRDRRTNLNLSLDYGLMDSLTQKIRAMMLPDTTYKKGAEYGICIADGNGRIIAMADAIKGLTRPDPNDKAVFNDVLDGDDGIVSQSLLRKQIGNINLLRMNPGPGSTLKPIVFAAIASQMNLDWDAFESEGFSVKQHSYGGAKVAEYDFEKDNGVINTVNNYLRYSDNYYHSNVLLLGSYPKQEISALLASKFSTSNSGSGFQWPYFNYHGHRFWLNSFNKWPGFEDGKAYFGGDSSFTSIGLNTNFGIYTKQPTRNFDLPQSNYDSMLFQHAGRKSGFILAENALFDQQGEGIDHRIPYDVFTACFRGHVKGSSQVRIPPARMVEAIGKLTSQNRNYSLTLDPYAGVQVFQPFNVDGSIPYNNYLSLIRENVFAGMSEALFSGTAARLGSMLKNGSPYFYYGKTGTTGDDELKTKSKLFTIVISQKNIADPDYNFRNNRFYTIYFTSQNGPASQNEVFQAEIIRFVESSDGFVNYMRGIK